MSEAHVHVTLSPAEWRLVCALREVPEGSVLRARVDALLAELVHFVRDPHCGEMQADGVPCATPRADCDECAEMGKMVDQLAAAHDLAKA